MPFSLSDTLRTTVAGIPITDQPEKIPGAFLAVATDPANTAHLKVGQILAYPDGTYKRWTGTELATYTLGVKTSFSSIAELVGAADAERENIAAGAPQWITGLPLYVEGEPTYRVWANTGVAATSHAARVVLGMAEAILGGAGTPNESLAVIELAQAPTAGDGIVGQVAVFNGSLWSKTNSTTWAGPFTGFGATYDETRKTPNLTLAQAQALTGLQDGDVVRVAGSRYHFDPTTTMTGDGFIAVTAGGTLVRIGETVISVLDFDGADFTQKLQAAAAASYWGAVLFIPQRSRAADLEWQLDGPITLSKMYSGIRGESMGGTRINFNPPNASGENVALSWDYNGPVATPTYFCSMENISFTTADTTRIKLILDLIDHGEFYARRVSLRGGTDPTNSCMAARTWGRESMTFDDCYFRGDRPIVFRRNPSYEGTAQQGFLSVDAFQFRGGQIGVTAGKPGTLIEVESGAQVSGLKVIGTGLIGGNRAFKYINTAALAAGIKSQNIVFDGCRYEQLHTAAGEPWFAEISAFQAGDIMSTRFKNNRVETGGNGFLLNNLDDVVIDQSGVDSSLKTLVNATNCSMAIRAPYSTLGDNAVTTTNMVEEFAVLRAGANLASPPRYAEYNRLGAINVSSTFYRGIRIGGSRLVNIERTYGAFSGINLPIANNLTDYRSAIVTIAVREASNAWTAYGVYKISTNAVGDNGIETITADTRISTLPTLTNDKFNLRSTGTAPANNMQTIAATNMFGTAVIARIRIEYL